MRTSTILHGLCFVAAVAGKTHTAAASNNSTSSTLIEPWEPWYWWNDFKWIVNHPL
jgi:hypothetical protein